MGRDFSSVVDWSTAQVNKAVRVNLNTTTMTAVVLSARWARISIFPTFQRVHYPRTLIMSGGTRMVIVRLHISSRDNVMLARRIKPVRDSVRGSMIMTLWQGLSHVTGKTGKLHVTRELRVTLTPHVTGKLHVTSKLNVICKLNVVLW